MSETHLVNMADGFQHVLPSQSVNRTREIFPDLHYCSNNAVVLESIFESVPKYGFKRPNIEKRKDDPELEEV